MSFVRRYAGIPSFNSILNWALKFKSIDSVSYVYWTVHHLDS